MDDLVLDRNAEPIIDCLVQIGEKYTLTESEKDAIILQTFIRGSYGQNSSG